VYLKKFNNMVDVLKHSGALVGVQPGMIYNALTEAGTTRAAADSAQLKTAEAKAQETYLTTSFLLASDRNRFGKLIEDIKNDYLLGDNNNPKTLMARSIILAT
jgi:hypothetical protein